MLDGKASRGGPASKGSTVRIAEVNAGFPFALGSFGCFLALVLGDFFLGVRKGVARREHSVPANLLLLLANGAKLAANKPDGCVNHLDLDQKIADLLQKVVKVVGANHVR